MAKGETRHRQGANGGLTLQSTLTRSREPGAGCDWGAFLPCHKGLQGRIRENGPAEDLPGAWEGGTPRAR